MSNTRKLAASLTALLALLLALCLLLGGCGGEAESSTESSTSSSSSSSSSSESATPTPTEEPVQPLPEFASENADAYAAAVKANDDCVAWLNIPGTDVNFPVMQADDNVYYWQHDPERNPLAYGSVYAHFNSNLSSQEALYRNTVLFGHNKYATFEEDYDVHNIFSTLLFFQGQQWAQSHRYLTLTIGEETTYWVIFSALDTETANDQKTFYYWNTCFEENKSSFKGSFSPTWQTDKDWRAILDQAMDRSYWNYDIEVDEKTDKVITLSTCSYDWGMYSGITNSKFVIMARQLRADELENGLDFIEELPELTVNEDRREPSDCGKDGEGRVRRWISVCSGQYRPEEYTEDMELPEGMTLAADGTLIEADAAESSSSSDASKSSSTSDTSKSSSSSSSSKTSSSSSSKTTSSKSDSSSGSSSKSN